MAPSDLHISPARFQKMWREMTTKDICECCGRDKYRYNLMVKVLRSIGYHAAQYPETEEAEKSSREEPSKKKVSSPRRTRRKKVQQKKDQES